MSIALFTLDQVAKLLGISRATVNRMVKRGELQAVKIGGHRRVTGREFHAYCDARGIVLETTPQSAAASR